MIEPRAASAPRIAVLRWLVVAAPLAALLAGLASPAAAHARLTASEPTSGATLDQAPAAVVLTFNEAIEPDFNQVQVRDAEGGRVDAGAAEGEGETVRVSLQRLSVAGTYTVVYRVISADGHPVEGSFEFEVTDAAVADAAPQEADPGETDAGEPTSEASPAPGGAATSAPTEPAAGTPPPADAEAAATTEDRADEDGGIPLLLVAVAVLLVVGAIVLLATRGGSDERPA